MSGASGVKSKSYADRFDFVEFVDQYLELRQQVGVDYLGIGMAVSRQGQRPPR